MSHSASAPVRRVLHEFTIRRDPRGHWVAAETHGLGGGVFFTCKEALRFALSEADGDESRIHVEAVPIAR